jgi:hypothetical protein
MYVSDATKEAGAAQAGSGAPGESMPAPFANQFSIAMGDEIARLVFGELPPGGSFIYPRAAVTFPARGLRALAELILSTVTDHEKKIAENAGAGNVDPARK